MRVLVPWPVPDTFKRTKWPLFLWPCHVLLDAVPCIGACVLGCQDLECGLTGGTRFPWPLRPSPMCVRFTLVIAQGFEDGELALAGCHSFGALSLALCVEFFLNKASGSSLRVGRRGSSLGRAGLLFSRAP